MRLRLEYIGRGAKWSLLALQFACILNPYLVTGVDEPADTIASESRSPYVYLAQREYVRDSVTGNYEEVNRYNTTDLPPTTQGSTPQYSSEEDELPETADQSGQDSVTSQRFENAFTSFHFADNDGRQRVQRSDKNPGNIQEILHHRQGEYTRVSTSSPPVYHSNAAPSYDSIHYQSPLVSYEVPSNYFPNDNYDWPQSGYTSTYGPPPAHGGSSGGGNPGPGGLVIPFINGVGQLTSSVKHLKSQIGEQKAQKAFQFGEAVKSTGQAVNNAILTKGQAAGQVIGQTIQAVGDGLANKGWKAQQVIQNKGQLASQAIASAGNIGAGLLRSKGELVGAIVKTSAALGTGALSATSNALAGGTRLVAAKGNAASNLIAGGSRLTTGIIGTKGRIISNVINAKGQFLAQIVEAKGRGVASVLETSGQKLTQLADAIKSATAQKNPPPPPTPGWNSNTQWSGGFSETQETVVSKETGEKVVEAELQKTEEPVISNHQHAHQYQPESFQQDYQDSYYDPRDTFTYKRSGRSGRAREQEQSEEKSSVRDQGRNRAVAEQEDDGEDFENEYSSYYLPHHYSPSQHQDYAQVQYTPEPW